MPFTMKIQPIDMDSGSGKETAGKAVLKSRLKRLFDRPFTSVLRSANSHGVAELEPSSVCLAKMVQNFIEENNEKQAKCGRNRCNCFNGNKESSDDESDLLSEGGSLCDAWEQLKSLIPCASLGERNLLADAARIVDRNKSVKRKEEMRKMVNEGLLSLGYDSAICKSRWDKSPSFPAGEYEYIDVIIGDERLLIDVDFRSEFDIARQTSGYKALLHSLPFIFVGKSDRLTQIVSLISEAAKHSLRRKGMHLPPWRKADYMRSKWLSPHTRASPNAQAPLAPPAAHPDLLFQEKSLFTSSSAIPPIQTDVKPLTGLASLFNKNPSNQTNF